MRIISLIITGLVLPLFLIPLEKFLPYPEILEEISKAVVVLFLILGFSSLKQKIEAGVLFGFLFGISESFFYLTNIFQVGDFNIFWQRFLYTVPMHIITVLIILFFGVLGKKIIPRPKILAWGFIGFGLAIAIILHSLFNIIVAS